MEGGYGYKPSDVAEMTLDQIFFLLCDKEVLRGSEKSRIARYDATSVASSLPTTADGLVSGRDKNGQPMKAKILGMSKAARLAIEQAKKKEQERAEAEKQPKKKRRR